MMCCFTYCFVAVVVVLEYVVLLVESVLFWWLLFELDSTNCLEFCSNVFAAFTLRFERCLELSRACCNVDFHESRFEKMMLFVSLIAETALSAKLLTSLVYACVMEFGEVKFVIYPLKLSLYGLHAD